MSAPMLPHASRAIDALRGYAILMVVCAHALRHVPALPWPAKRFLLLGVYGVQLFFLASAVTLLMSWSRGAPPWPARCRDFFIHRWFRIAPLYFLAIVFYWIVERRGAGEFSAAVLAATLFFYNAWSPYFIRTVPGWIPVPGGWSIGVEFCFYLIFPALAMTVTSARRSLLLIVCAGALMALAARHGAALYPEITAEERANFLYFWPPNHLLVFALGFLLYHCLRSRRLGAAIAGGPVGGDQASVALLLALLALSLYGMRKEFDWRAGLPPTHVLITLLFLPWALVLLLKPAGWFVNRAIVAFGRVSFSVYILHFAVLDLVGALLARCWPFATDGAAALAYAAALLALACGLTFAVARLTYRYIEKPCIRYGALLAGRCQNAR